MTCESARKWLSLFLYSELSFAEEEALQQHLDECEGCRRELEREKVWHDAVEAQEAQVPPGLLAQCRQELRMHLRSIPGRSNPLAAFWEGFRRSLHAAYLRPVGAVALLMAGFFAARLSHRAGFSLFDETPSGLVATQVRNLQPDASGRVSIVLDETRQRVLSGSLGDEPIRRLLLSAANDSSDPGLRVESMDLLKGQTASAEVRRALLGALQHDPNAGVRLKAIEGLKSLSADPETRAVLTQVLLKDDNPGVRTQAIDLLVQHKEVGLAGVLQEVVQRGEDNGYVRLRCQKALRDMNASVGTF